MPPAQQDNSKAKKTVQWASNLELPPGAIYSDANHDPRSKPSELQTASSSDSDSEIGYPLERMPKTK
ncbi:hypothetical protein KEM56_007567 [Ascosphaera pollenicola]|nr:hypothetical protein KEM56_007567 [Ascosphaera pollenicola]